MWWSQLLGFQSDLRILAADGFEGLTPIQINNIMLDRKDDSQDLGILDVPLSDSASRPALDPAWNDSEPEPLPSPGAASRSEWTEDEEVSFFNFLGSYMIQNPDQFLAWNKANRKGIFKDMEVQIKSKDKVQCRLKFNSYKRKHSVRRNRAYYEPCMKALILKKLENFANFCSQSRQVLEKVRQQDRQIKQKEQIVQGHIKQLQKDREDISQIFTKTPMKQEPTVRNQKMSPKPREPVRKKFNKENKREKNQERELKIEKASSDEEIDQFFISIENRLGQN